MESFHDPVIIVPGILGSEEKNSQWQIDPVFHTYDNLYEEFSNNGYVPEKDLFTFPYEWRNSNVSNAQLLRAKIQEIKQQENWPVVDIVAHSMGGLLAREYIESNNYNDDIDQLITLGTPNNGAPEAYPKWEAGAFIFTPGDIYLKHRFSQEAKENGFDNIFYYIHGRPIISVKELLPVYGYLYEVENGNQLREYPNNYPVNTFLENLNSEAKKENLLKVELDKIIGNVGDASSTTSGFKIINADLGEYWTHGYPHGFEIPLIGDRGIIYNNGDGTVPFESAKSENIFADEFIETDSVHRELPTNAQKDVLEILTGARPDSEVKHSLIKDILIISVYSPVDIQIIDPDGKKVGKDFVTGEILNEIPGAFYSGYGAENEFLTIPNPLDGEYKILTEGTGDGEYKIEVAKISESENFQEAKESVATIEGAAQTGVVNEENKIEIEGDEVIAPEQKDEIAPEVNIDSPEAKEYQNNENLPVSFTVSDNKSALENIETEVFFDGQEITESNIDLSLQNLGEHKLKVTAQDEEGNLGEKEVAFQIVTNIDSIVDNVSHYADLGMIEKNTEKKLLKLELKKIDFLMNLLEEIKVNPKLSDKAKAKLIRVSVRSINYQIDSTVKYIQKQTGKTINSQASELLIESLEYIKL